MREARECRSSDIEISFRLFLCYTLISMASEGTTKGRNLDQISILRCMLLLPLPSLAPLSRLRSYTAASAAPCDDAEFLFDLRLLPPTTTTACCFLSSAYLRRRGRRMGCQMHVRRGEGKEYRQWKEILVGKLCQKINTRLLHASLPVSLGRVQRRLRKARHTF